MIRCWMLLPVAIGLFGCSSASSQMQQSIALGTEVTLALGATALLQAEEVSIQFDGVTADSRCPQGITCVWAGEATVALTIRIDSQPAIRQEVAGGKDTVVGSYRVTVIEVLPQARESVRIAPEDYRATVKVQKL